jgi:hypothetical protein
MKPTTLLTILLLGCSQFLLAQTQKRYIPPPLRVHVPLDKAWESLGTTLETTELPIYQQDRDSGKVRTDYVEYSSGPLTASHIAKVGERPKLLDSDWVRVEYQYDVDIVYIQERETLVNVNANIRALKRSFLGGDEWVVIRSNGQLEEAFLTRFGQTIFGDSFSLERPKKGYWDRSPEYIQDADIQPRVAGPERRPH